MKTYEALIFDLGKVVFDLSFDQVFHHWAIASGQAANTIKSSFQFDELFDAFERGTVSAAAFRREISRRLGLQLTDQAFDEGWCALYLDPYEGINELLSTLKDQYRLVALTNTNSIHAQAWKSKYRESLTHFDKVFSSHELGARKPEKQAYQSVLNYLCTKPERAIFLDDSPINIQGAVQLGIRAILVQSTQQMQVDLNHLINP